MICSTEELIVALADKLWKGKRDEALELMVIDEDSKGHVRLSRSFKQK